MTFEILLIFTILIGVLAVFALDLFPADFVAFATLALILGLGFLLDVEPEEAISGFSNPATITVMAMFILSGAVERTGVINLFVHRLVHFVGDSELRQLVSIALIVGPVSAFINNTAAVAILMPVVITLARAHQRSPSKLLIPLSYLSQLAGVITLIGTSTNILASTLSARQGYGAFGMFEFSQIGLLVFITGAGYLLFVGRWLLPDRRVEPEVIKNYQMKEYLTEVVVLDGSPLIGKTTVTGQLREQFDMHVLEILRKGQKLSHPLSAHLLQADDILFVKINPAQLVKITNTKNLAIVSEGQVGEPRLSNKNMAVLEVVIGPNSDLIGGTLESTIFRHHYNCSVIALRKHGEILRERLGEVSLNFGDTLLLRGAQSALEQIKREPGFIITEQLQLDEYRTEKIPVALAIIVGVVVVAVFGVPILVTAVIGCVLMVLTGCLKVNELHQAIRWDVIFLLAGVIPLGLALERTGAARWLADLMAQSAVYVSPFVVLVLFYVIASSLTEVISNNAAVVVLVPVAIATAETLGLDTRAFILAIMFAASNSFATPVGYQTNTMIYGPGGYKFLDFVRVGLPLNVLMAIATPLYIYFLWGL